MCFLGPYDKLLGFQAMLQSQFGFGRPFMHGSVGGSRVVLRGYEFPDMGL